MEMLSGFATQEGTTRFASRYNAQNKAGFYRQAQDTLVSNIGIGSYLGDVNDETDRGYTESMMAALRGGINFIDTSLNYRHQRSELAIGAAIDKLASAGEMERDEFVLCTKAGYLVPRAVTNSELDPDDIAGGVHTMAPPFLRDQLARSRKNLGLETIDVFYLHNPETQLEFIDTERFYNRLRLAFECLEREAASGAIRYYGTATWEGYRGSKLSLSKIVAIAKEVGGDRHRFRYIQLPFNLAMLEALTLPVEDDKTVLELAEELGVTVIGSASILQGRLSVGLPERLLAGLPGLNTDAQRAIQFTRSAPGLTVALAGMSRIAHVAENLQLSTKPPSSAEEYARLFR